MEIVVTGGLGFIGSNFTEYMLKLNPEMRIVNIDSLSHGSSLNSQAPFEENPNYKLVRGDICDAPSFRDHILGADAIVNFAAESHVDRSIDNPVPFVRSNIQGVVALLEVVRRSRTKIRFVQVGTDESYGDIPDGSFKESDLLSPSSPYAASKAAADMLCKSYFRTYGVDVVTTRCANNYGPRQSPEKLIPRTIIRAILNRHIPIYGSGDNIRDWLYVEDHCHAIASVLMKGRAGEIYNVSANEEWSNLNVVNTILHHLGRSQALIRHVEDRLGHDRRYSMDSTKIRTELNWIPQRSFQSALAATIEWYVNNETWWKPLASEAYIGKW